MRSLSVNVGLQDIPYDDVAEFSKPDFNGREIKTITNSAESTQEKLEAQHVREALAEYESSSRLRTSLNPPSGRQSSAGSSAS